MERKKGLMGGFKERREGRGGSMGCIEDLDAKGRERRRKRRRRDLVRIKKQ